MSSDGKEFGSFQLGLTVLQLDLKLLILTSQLPEFECWDLFPFFIVHVVEINIQRNNVFTLGNKKKRQET